MSFPLRVRTFVCSECKKPFKSQTANAKRCPDCRDWRGKAIKAEKPQKENAS